MQIRTLLVGVIKPESPATAAAILASSDPAKTWHDYEQSNGKMALTIPKAIPPEKMKMLNVNQQLMDDLGANVTPAIYYMNKDNMLQQVVGLPDKEKLHIMMGEKVIPSRSGAWRKRPLAPPSTIRYIKQNLTVFANN